MLLNETENPVLHFVKNWIFTRSLDRSLNIIYCKFVYLGDLLTLKPLIFVWLSYDVLYSCPILAKIFCLVSNKEGPVG